MMTRNALTPTLSPSGQSGVNICVFRRIDAPFSLGQKWGISTELSGGRGRWIPFDGATRPQRAVLTPQRPQLFMCSQISTCSEMLSASSTSIPR